MSLDRRSFIQGTAAAGLTLAAPSILRAQSNEPVRLGLLTVKNWPSCFWGNRYGTRLKTVVS
jgi:branched-chain amino acid transport system substrate-binding protein